MILYIRLLSVFVLTMQLDLLAQQLPADLKGFFERRLTDRQDAPPPSYETLLKMIDGIAKADAAEIQAALPIVSSALKSNINNLPVEAAFAMTEIARRKDGGPLLRGRLVDLEHLLTNTDTRLSGGATLVFSYITPSIPDLTVPILLNQLNKPGKPTKVKSEIMRVLLKSKKNDVTVLKAVENYLDLEADPQVRIVNLQIIASDPVLNSAKIRTFAVRSLDDTNKYVKIAALRSVYALGSDVRRESLIVINRLAADPDSAVREMADKVRRDTIADPVKKFPSER